MVSTSDVVVSEVPAVDAQATKEIISITEDDFDKAQKTFQLGKKNLILNKYDESVNNIGDACKIFTAKYGEFDPQCAEIYYYYGRALLELARVENTVLGNALNGVNTEETGPIDDSRYGNPEEIPPEEKKEISDKVIDALCENNDASIVDKKEEEATVTTPEAAATTNGDAPVAEKVVEAEKTVETTTTTTTTTETPATTETETKAEEENGEEDEEDDEEEDEDEDLTKNDEQVKDEAENEEISSLQRAWEMFALAKLVYTKNFSDDLKFKNKRIAECLLKLGEISIEQEVYEQAITDIGESIKLQEAEETSVRDERMLAETFYQLGLAQQFANAFTDAAESFQKSINIIQLRVEKLKGKLETGPWTEGDADAELEKNTIKDEIAEMEGLLPEMTSKLEEVTAQDQDSAKLIQEAKECFMNGAGAAAVAAPIATAMETNGEVKDITSLVKSKRKLGSCDDEETNVKKTRLSDVPNGEEATEKMETPATTVEEPKPIEVTTAPEITA